MRPNIALITLVIVFVLALMAMMAMGEVGPSHANGPVTRYVATTGADSGNCSSPDKPCRTIQYAVNQSFSGDTILVAQGVYTDTSLDPCQFLRTRSVVCFVDKRLTIRGGYSATDWAEADPARNPTIIDGGSSHRGVAVVGYQTTDAHLEMTGFIIRNCRAEGPAYANDPTPISFGGGMLVLHASITLRDMVFRNNKVQGPSVGTGVGGPAYGAALYIYKPLSGAVSYIRGVTFEANESYGGNGADRGGIAFGALYIDNAKVIVEDSTFVGNIARAGSATGSGQGGNPPEADALGGGIGVQESNLTLRHVTIKDNQVIGGDAQEYGGGAYGGGIFVEDVVSDSFRVQVYISDSYVAGNIAVGGNGVEGGRAVGGGICATNSQITIERTQIISNSAIGGSGSKAGLGSGGGIYTSALRENTGAHITFRNVVVGGNFVNQGNGETPRSDSGGGGVVIHGMSADIVHTTLAQNRLGPSLFLGQALLILPWPSLSLPATVTFQQGIIADHTAGASNAAAVVVEQGSTLTFEQGLFAGNLRNTNVGGNPVSPGTINGLSTVENAQSAGFISPGSPHHNYHLRLDSEARDRSTQTIISDDIDQESRPYGRGADFGADEYHPFPAVAIPGDSTLRIDWTVGARRLIGGVEYFEVLVSCEEDADPPNEVGCSQSLNMGSGTFLMLTGLTNFKPYTVEVKAYNGANTLVATSQVIARPTNLFVFLPFVWK